MGNPLVRAAAAFALAVLGATSCVRGLEIHPKVASSPTTEPAGTTPAVAAAATDPPGPPPRITTPMAGDPDDAALMDARLVTQACTVNEEARSQLVQKRIDDMRADVDQTFRSWLAELGPCKARRGDATGESFGLGGLGLFGVGEGGGGRGEGIGLGSVGAILPRQERLRHEQPGRRGRRT